MQKNLAQSLSLTPLSGVVDVLYPLILYCDIVPVFDSRERTSKLLL